MLTPLKRYREMRGLTQKSVAEELDIDPSHYRRIEIAEVKPSAAVAEKIARHFGYAVTELHILYPERYAQPEVAKAS